MISCKKFDPRERICVKSTDIKKVQSVPPCVIEFLTLLFLHSPHQILLFNQLILHLFRTLNLQLKFCLLLRKFFLICIQVFGPSPKRLLYFTSNLFVFCYLFLILNCLLADTRTIVFFIFQLRLQIIDL